MITRLAHSCRCILAACLLLSLSGPGAAIDVPENIDHAWLAPLAPRALLTAIDAVDGRLVAVGERGHILYRDTGQQQWRQADVPVQVLLTSVYMQDAQQGWAVGHDAVILHTQDGGHSWRKQFEAIDEQRPLLDVRVGAAGRGLAIGAYGYLLRTQDGGRHWQAAQLREDEDLHLNALSATPAGRIYIAAEAGRVYRSDDRGDHWRVLETPYQGSFFDVLALDEDRVLLLGLRGHAFYSEDAGVSWRAIETGTRATLTSALRLSDGRILITAHAGEILLYTPGSARAERARLPNRQALSDVAEPAPGRLLLVGEHGVEETDISALIPVQAGNRP